MSEIDLTLEQLNLIKHVLSKHLSKTAKVWIFGSRVTGKAKPYSDIDLVIDLSEPAPIELLAALTNSFIDSELPYKVDLVDWCSIDNDFRDLISQKRQRIL